MRLAHNQTIDNFSNHLDQDVQELILRLSEKGIGSVLVGGAVRDWVMTGNLSDDLDFEIYPLNEMNEDSWLELLKKTFAEGYERNDFNVYKKKIKHLDIEFAPARTEVYEENKIVFSHSSFKASYLTSFNPAVSFARRDFTCNAMAVHFHNDEYVFIDPFDGINAIGKKELVPCGESFFCDPVRFLRAMRFHILFNFSFSEGIETEIKKMNIEKLSEYYLFKEAFKSRDFFKFVKTSFDYINKYSIKVPSFFKDFEELNLNFSYLPRTKMDLFLGLCVHSISLETLSKLNTFFQFKKGTINRWFELLNLLRDLKIDDLRYSGSFEDYKNEPLSAQSLELYILGKRVEWTKNEYSALKEIHFESFEKLESLRQLFSQITKEQSIDYASLKPEDRKLMQTYQLFKL